MFPGGCLTDSHLEEGFILNKKIGVGQPKRIENPKIMVANTSMDADKIKIFGSRVRTESMSQVAEIEAAEKQKMKDKCKKIVDHGINVFINRQLILRLKGSTQLDQIQIVMFPGGCLTDSHLEEGFILNKKIGVGQPKRIENPKIMVANTSMDADKIKIFGSRVRTESMSQVAEIEAAEKQNW